MNEKITVSLPVESSESVTEGLVSVPLLQALKIMRSAGNVVFTRWVIRENSLFLSDLPDKRSPLRSVDKPMTLLRIL